MAALRHRLTFRIRFFSCFADFALLLGDHTAYENHSENCNLGDIVKSILRATVAASVVLSASLAAQAADLPQPPPPLPQAPVAYIPAAPPVYDWGGVYVGINGGWGWGNGKWTCEYRGTHPFCQCQRERRYRRRHARSNYQMNAFVFGVEGDWDYSGINTGTTANVCTF